MTGIGGDRLCGIEPACTDAPDGTRPHGEPQHALPWPGSQLPVGVAASACTPPGLGTRFSFRWNNKVAWSTVCEPLNAGLPFTRPHTPSAALMPSQPCVTGGGTVKKLTDLTGAY